MRQESRAGIVGIGLVILSVPALLGHDSAATNKVAPAKAVSAAESRTRAVSALVRAQRFAGGSSQIQAIRDITRTVELVQARTGAKARQTIQIILPRTLRLTNSTGVQITAFFDGLKGWVQTPWGIDDPLPGWQARAAEQDVFKQLEVLLIVDRQAEVQLAWVEPGGSQEPDADCIEVTSKVGGTVRLWIDAKTGEPIRLEYPRITSRGPGPRVSDSYSDYRVVQGIRVPFRISSVEDGNAYMETLVTSIEYNKGLRFDDLARLEPAKR